MFFRADALDQPEQDDGFIVRAFLSLWIIVAATPDILIAQIGPVSLWET